MYKGNRIICVIPARSGSKGLRGKNVKKILGKPLIMYSIEQARKSRYIDRIVVSTDSREIAQIAKRGGAEAPFIRPKKLAADKSSIFDVLLHAIDWIKEKERCDFDILVLLHANAPLRKVRDIDNCIELLFKENADNVFSVCEAHRNPYFNMVEVNNDGRPRLIKKGKFVNRQDAPKVYDLNSSIYVWRKDLLKEKKSILLKKSRIYIMPKERSVDIDDYFDFRVARMLMQRAHR